MLGSAQCDQGPHQRAPDEEGFKQLRTIKGREASRHRNRSQGIKPALADPFGAGLRSRNRLLSGPWTRSWSRTKAGAVRLISV